MIRLQGVSRVYRDGEREIPALAAVDLTIAAGSSVALIGRSGSGKSTLLHLIGGLEWPSAGRVEVAGQELSGLDDTALTRFRLTRIGFIFQFFHLLPALSVWENLLLPTELAGLRTREAAGRARDLLEAVSLADRAHSYPERLSGGEQQRVAVARALMLEPAVLLADEPTGNLDSHTGRQVMDLLWALARERGTTLVIATHSMELAQQAERILELRDGRIVADRAPDGGRGRTGGPASAPAGAPEPGA